MIQQEVLQRVIETQKNDSKRFRTGFRREILLDLHAFQSQALIVTGIRHGGKSTLLKQMFQTDKSKKLFLNFEDPRLFNFYPADFEILDSIIEESKSTTLFLDEIQVIHGWELYVLQKLNEGYRVVVTGSNASMLSRTWGAKLTGRHVSKELLPFSYREFLEFKSLQANEMSLNEYMETGGFPEFLKTGKTETLIEIFHDIFNHDVLVRHGIKNLPALKNFAVYLTSNVGNHVTSSDLHESLGIKSTAMLAAFCSFLEDTSMVSFMPRFSYLYRNRIGAHSPRKIYVIDPGIIKIASVSLEENRDHLLENLIYWELRRRGKKLCYFSEHKIECDFLVMQNEKVEQVIQVCYELSRENREREMSGLKLALDSFKINNGLIISFSQRDTVIHKGKRIEILPAWEFLTESSKKR